MKYLVFIICFLALAYAEEEKLGLQRLTSTNGRNRQRAAQTVPRTNGQTNGARQTRVAAPVNLARQNFRTSNPVNVAAQYRGAAPTNFAAQYGVANPTTFGRQYAAVNNPTNYRATNFVGTNGQYNPALATQVQYGRSAVPLVNSQFYGNGFIGRQAVGSLSPFIGLEANPAFVTMARQVAASNGPNIPWSQIVQEKIDMETSLGLQPFLGRGSVFGNSPFATPLIAQQPLLGLYGYGQFNPGLSYTQQQSYRPTSSTTTAARTGQQLFGRTSVAGYNPFFGAYARRK